MNDTARHDHVPAPSRRAMLGGALVAAGGTAAALVAGARPAHAAGTSEYDVKAYGALGNGVADDTVAIQATIAAAQAADGGIVFFPPGLYRVSATLIVTDGIRIEGVGWSVDRATRLSGSFLYCTTPNVQVLRVLNSARGTIIRDLGFRYAQPVHTTNPYVPTTYGWAIQIEADDSYVDNVLLHNASHGIYLFGNGAVGRVTLNRIFGMPLVEGIRVNNALDVCYISNVHFWPFWGGVGDTPLMTWLHNNAKGIVLGRADNPKLEAIFTFGYRYGVHVTNFGQGTANRFQLSNADFDGSQYAVLVEANNASGQITNLTATGLASPLTTDVPLFVNANGCIVAAVNLRLGAVRQNGIRVGGQFNRVSLENVDIDGYGLTPAPFPGIESLSANNTVMVGFGRTIINGSAGAPQTGGPGIRLDA